MLGIEREFTIFLAACLDGILLCLIYIAIRVFRRIVPHNLFWISMEDLIYWVGTGFYLFTEMFRACAGNIRWYFVLGVVAGGGLIFIIERKLTKKYIDKSGKTR